MTSLRVGVFISLLLAFMVHAAPAGKPNIVLFLCDDLGYSEVGCYGQAKIKTPNVDKLAAEGMRFTQFYCGSPVCAPSRCTLMTGLHTGHTVVRARSRRSRGRQRRWDASGSRWRRATW